MEADGDKIVTYRDAMVPKTMPKSLMVVGSGAIGIECEGEKDKRRGGQCLSPTASDAHLHPDDEHAEFLNRARSTTKMGPRRTARR